MGRRSMVSDCDIFSAVSQQVALGRDVNIQEISRATKTSIGSLYHRYGSREALTAAAWLDGVKAFQARFLAALEGPGEDAGLRAALATPVFARECRAQAVILTLGRRETMFHASAPAEMREELDELNARSQQALVGFADRFNLSVKACSLGIVAYPLAAVRLYLPTDPVPERIDDYVAVAYRSAIDLGRQRLKS